MSPFGGGASCWHVSCQLKCHPLFFPFPKTDIRGHKMPVGREKNTKEGGGKKAIGETAIGMMVWKDGLLAAVTFRKCRGSPHPHLPFPELSPSPLCSAHLCLPPTPPAKQSYLGCQASGVHCWAELVVHHFWPPPAHVIQRVTFCNSRSVPRVARMLVLVVLGTIRMGPQVMNKNPKSNLTI